MRVSNKKKYENFFASLKSLKKGSGSGVGSGSISQMYGSAYPDPDPHQNVTDPQHWSCHSFPISLIRYLGEAVAPD
jgi:hypothetical protein